MSKNNFFLMRAEEMATLYDSTFTKKEAVLTGKNLVKSVLENGEVDKMRFGANLIRLNEVIGSAVTEFRNEIIDEPKQTVLGVEFNPVNGGESLNYKDDPIYSDIQKELKEREEILKLAYKSKNEIYDETGVQVPKVSSTPRKSSITVKF
jgi:hypothetical protein